jgi:hypothetical protein
MLSAYNASGLKVMYVFNAEFADRKERVGKEHILKVEGPLGVWSYRNEAHPNGGWNSLIRAPKNVKAYSKEGLLQALSKPPFNIPEALLLMPPQLSIAELVRVARTMRPPAIGRRRATAALPRMLISCGGVCDRTTL